MHTDNTLTLSPIHPYTPNATAVIDGDGNRTTTPLYPNLELLLPSWHEHSSSFFCKPSNPRIDKWLQKPSSINYVSNNGDLVSARCESNTLSLWIDLTRSIRFSSAFRRTTLWTAAEMAEMAE
jgi:hypothetical protein